MEYIVEITITAKPSRQVLQLLQSQRKVVSSLHFAFFVQIKRNWLAVVELIQIFCANLCAFFNI